MPRSTPKPASACVTVDASRQGRQFEASLIAADGYIYVVNEAGTFAVLRSGDTLELGGTEQARRKRTLHPGHCGRHPLRSTFGPSL